MDTGTRNETANPSRSDILQKSKKEKNAFEKKYRYITFPSGDLDDLIFYKSERRASEK